ncbi:hypothetical protein TVAGG3_0191350, partial [Trichomonas vaginalis G3]|uniref:hypothetical protein n=1 Tax=Trichomonas vaginalis (strain ATCC PRA-98 / G3) TaxID=412133 RepID=UPI0021E54080
MNNAALRQMSSRWICRLPAFKPIPYSQAQHVKLNDIIKGIIHLHNNNQLKTNQI